VKYFFKCPKCGSDEEFIVPEDGGWGSDLGCLFLSFGGLIPAFLYSAAVRRRIQCTRCFYLFRQPPLPESSLARFAKWVIVIAAVPIAVAWVLSKMPDTIAQLPGLPGIGEIEKEVLS
jgi:hypothetical protein